MNKLKHSKRVVIGDNPADIDVPDHPYRVQDSGGDRWIVAAAIEGRR